MENSYQILPVSEGCLYVKFGENISPEINRQARKLSNYVEKHPFAGFIETVVSYTGLAVLYAPGVVRKAGKNMNAKEKLLQYIEKNEKIRKAETAILVFLLLRL